jgi:hypothetical protein
VPEPARAKAKPAPEEPSAKIAAKKPDPAKARAEAKKKADALAARKKADAEAKLAKANPERVWVQVAGGANKSDLPKAWAGVKAKAPDLLKGKTASTTKLRATNRLLVGPFKSRDEAQALVNKLPGAFIVTTDEGQAVERLKTG